MEKAYDVKGLVEHLKDEGLEIAEESAKAVYQGVKKWLEDSAKKSENSYDDLLLAVLPMLDSMIMEKLEDINKADNE